MLFLHGLVSGPSVRQCQPCKPFNAVSKFRIVIFSSASPTSLDHFLRRLEQDLPEVAVAGVLYEARPSRLTRSKKISRVLRLVRDSDFRAFLSHRIRQRLSKSLEKSSSFLLRVLHAAPKNLNGEPLALGSIAAECRARQIEFHLTKDIHDSVPAGRPSRCWPADRSARIRRGAPGFTVRSRNVAWSSRNCRRERRPTAGRSRPATGSSLRSRG